MKSSIGIATASRTAPSRASRAPATRAPSSLSSGASTTLTKSKRPERRPLRLDARAELLELAVDLADALRVVLDRRDTLRRELREHDVRRHRASWLRPAGQIAPRSIPFGAAPVACPPWRCSPSSAIRTSTSVPETPGRPRRSPPTVRAVMALDPAPDAVLVLGDLTNAADARSYERVHELLAPLSAANARAARQPRRPRGPCARGSAAGAVEGSGGEPFRYAVRCGAAAARGVRHHGPRPRPDGRLDGAALAWLETTLAAEPDDADDRRDAPRFRCCSASVPMDAIGLPEANRAALAGVLGRFACVRRVVAGHVHRATFGLPRRPAPCSRARAPTCSCASTRGPDIDLEPGTARVRAAPPAPSRSKVVTLLQPVEQGAG